MHKWSLVFALVTAGSSFWEVRAAIGGQPTQQVLKITSDKEWTLTGQVQKSVCEMQEFAYTVNVPQTFTEKVEVDGVVKEVQVTKMVPEQRTATKTVCKFVSVVADRLVDPKTVKAFETDGRPIPTTAIASRLKGETLVVVSADQKMIPDYYATLFKPGTIILTVPPMDHVISSPPNAPPLPPTGPVTPQPVPAPAAPGPRSASVPTAVQTVSQVVQSVPGGPRPTSGPSIPATMAPELVFLGRDGVDKLKIRQFDEFTAPAELTAKSTDSSISPETMIKVERMTRHSETTAVDWRLLRISHPVSGDVAIDRVKEKLGTSGETTGLLSRDGGQVDAFWLQNIKPTVFVVRGVKLPPAGPTPPIGHGYGQGYGQGYAVPVVAPPAKALPQAPSPKPVPSAPAKESTGV